MRLKRSIMGVAIPPPVELLLRSYIAALQELNPYLYGVYGYGSVALGAFEWQSSDIDIVALIQGEWPERQLTQLRAIHKRLAGQYPLGRRMDAIYIPLCDIREPDGEIPPYPCVREGRFHPASHGDLNAVTRWMLQHRSICLFGPEGSTLDFGAQWADVLRAMRYNLDHYWADKAKSRPYLFLFDYWVAFSVSTLTRILSTVEEGEIISKSEALRHWRRLLPPRFHRLIDEASRIRRQPHMASLFSSRLGRMRETLAFIRYARERGLATLNERLPYRPL